MSSLSTPSTNKAFKPTPEQSAESFRGHSVAITENTEEFQAVLTSYYELYKPANRVEKDLIQDLADNRWRLHFIRRTRIHLINIQIKMLESEAKKDNADAKIAPRIAEALAVERFNNLKTSTALQRDERDCLSAYNRALKTLHQLNKQPIESFVQNETAPPYEPLLKPRFMTAIASAPSHAESSEAPPLKPFTPETEPQESPLAKAG